MMFSPDLVWFIGTIVWYFSSFSLATPIPDREGLQIVTNQKRYFNYGEGVVRGVNLGGWLVLEPYITPSLFETFRTNPDNDDGIPVDEYNFCKALGPELARSRLTAHWDAFYTEKDFYNIAAAGLNMVRIPVGYWAFMTLEDDPYVTKLQEEYLDKAIEWSRNAGLHVWIDLHGAPGSQNRFDNSGLRGRLDFLKEPNLSLLKEVLRYMLDKYSQPQYDDVIIGIQVLNEPFGPDVDMQDIKDLYYFAYDYLRNELCRDQVLVLHDAFTPPHYWDRDFTIESGHWGVLIDHHHYQVFSPGEVASDMDQKVRTACSWGTEFMNESHWSVTGEWSAALTDCAKWLNGVGRGARYDGTFPESWFIGSCENNEDVPSWSVERKNNVRRYIEVQLEAFEMKGGWIFWCYKTENAVEWDFQRLAYYGLFPQPLDHRLYPSQCA